jgi:tRNA threonylcarbamoyladenosine biosynthesis protein TsaE
LLHVKEEVSSPTFSLVNEYITDDNQTLFHFDFYRLRIEEEALDMGCEEYFESGNTCFIEWPENIPSLLPPQRIEVYISMNGSERLYNLKRKD